MVCDTCGLKSPSFESSSVLCITPTYTSSIQELILQGMQQQLEKCCFRCKKNTWHVESNYILQPPKYLIIMVNRFRYINNNYTKDRWSIHIDMTVVLGLHKFSLRATIDHHGPSLYWDHYTTPINSCKKYWYDRKLQGLKWLIPKTPLWVGWCVSSWRPWFWPVYSIYHIHTIHYSYKLCN